MKLKENEKGIKYFKAKVKSFDEKTHTATVVISDETKDRYDERVLVNSFTDTIPKFMEHAVLLSSHAYRGLMNQIGQFLNIAIDQVSKEVVATAEWFVGKGNPEADWGWFLATKGIAAFSIGFIPKVWKDYSEDERSANGGIWTDYEKIELLETSQVLVPANPSALQKHFGTQGYDEDPFIRDIMLLVKEKVMSKDVSDGIDWDNEEETRGWEETENEIRHRIKEPDLFSEFRYIKLKKDKPRVNAVYGKYKDKDEWAIQALRFPKADGWSIKSAKSWLKDHPEVVKIMEESEAVFVLCAEDDVTILEMGERLDRMEKMLLEIHGKIVVAAVESPPAAPPEADPDPENEFSENLLSELKGLLFDKPADPITQLFMDIEKKMTVHLTVPANRNGAE